MIHPAVRDLFESLGRHPAFEELIRKLNREESQQLAASVQQNLYTRLMESDPGLENWGVKKAPFIVLVATDMPAILAEVGCLSNSHEAKLLRTDAHRQKIAEALFEGIHAYAAANDTPQKKGT